jgi:thiosulfate dehydrogenase [quinone] large subunit
MLSANKETHREKENKIMALTSKLNRHIIDEPPFAKFLFGNPKSAYLWLGIRVWLGYQWISAASGKIGNPGWTETGESLKVFWERAVAIPETGRPAISFDWYRGFLQMMLDADAYTWFAKVIAYSELLIGVALIIGAFVGLAAFASGFLNWNFMMAGSASTNPLLFVAAVGLILAWKVGGYLGADRYLLPWIGTPWNRTVTSDEAGYELIADPVRGA